MLGSSVNTTAHAIVAFQATVDIGSSLIAHNSGGVGCALDLVRSAAAIDQVQVQCSADITPDGPLES